MSDRSPLPAIFTACLSLLFLFAFPQASHSQLPSLFDSGTLRGTSAIGHLQQMTGQQIGRFQPSGMPRMGGMGGIGGMLGMMMLECFINGAINAAAANNPQLAGQQAELQAWFRAEQQRLAAQVAKQRAKRDAEDRATMDQLVAALSSQGNGTKPASDLAGALSDPQVTIHNPTGTPFFGLGRGSATMDVFAVDIPKPTVDLSQRTSDVPNIPGNQKQPTSPMGQQIQYLAQGAKELQKLLRDFQNPKVVDQRLQKLEDDLAKALRLAKELKYGSMSNANEFEQYEQWLISVSGKTYLQGLGLTLTGVLNLAWDCNEEKMATAAGTTLLERLTDLRNNPAEWNKNMDALELISKSTMMARDSIIYAISEKDLEKAIELIADSLAKGLPKQYSPLYTPGKSLIKSALTLAKEAKIAGKIRKMDGPTQAYLGMQNKVDDQIRDLVKAINQRRQEVASNRGISVEDLKKLTHPTSKFKEPPVPLGHVVKD